MTKLTSPERCRLVARVQLPSGDPTAALKALHAEDSETQLLRSRALLALNQNAEALKAYERAVGSNTALEDPDLALQLRGTVREVDDGARRLRVISNDDTTESEVHRLLTPEVEQVSFQDVGGLDEIKTHIRRRIITPFQEPSLFAPESKEEGSGSWARTPEACRYRA